MYPAYVQLPDPDAPTLQAILKSTKFYLYFADVIGTIDRTHITCHPSAADHQAACDHKSNLTQNFLAACNFDMQFACVLSGF